MKQATGNMTEAIYCDIRDLSIKANRARKVSIKRSYIQKINEILDKHQVNFREFKAYREMYLAEWEARIKADEAKYLSDK